MLLGVALLIGLLLPAASPDPGLPAGTPGPIVLGRSGVPPLDRVEIHPGASGPVVERLQRALADHHLLRVQVDGRYGRATASAVIALHKLTGVSRDAVWHPEDLDRLEALDVEPILARHPGQLDRVEVDLDRQLLFVVRDGAVTDIVPVATGNGARYLSRHGGWVRARTPRGDFRLFKHIHGWRHNYLGALYEPWYFTPYYAIHGSGHVPARPASHGCVRVHTWDAAALRHRFFLGMPVHIWSGPARTSTAPARRGETAQRETGGPVTAGAGSFSL